MEHHHASTRRSFIEETVSPYRQGPHPVTRKGIVTATAEVEGSRKAGFELPTCSRRQISSPGVMPPQSGAAAPARGSDATTTTNARTHAAQGGAPAPAGPLEEASERKDKVSKRETVIRR